MNARHFLALACAALSLGTSSACTRQLPDQHDDVDVVSGQVKPEEAALVLSGSPFDEEMHTFKLAWRAESPGELIPRAEHRADASPLKPLAVESGQEIPWDASVLVVSEPLRVAARNEVTLVLAPRDEPSATVSLNIAQGQAVGVVKYEGEGTCLLQVAEALYHGDCPSTETFEADGWDGRHTPAAATWWVKVAGGWVVVDGVNLVGESVELQ